MNRFASFFAFTLSLAFAIPAAADGGACFPACRKGYLCTPEGKCVSECNPPCEGKQVCHSGECVAQRAPSDEGPLTENEPAPDSMFGAFGGPLLLASKFDAAPGVGAAFRFKTAGDHAFVAGIRGGAAFPANASFGIVGLDLGYRGNFRRGKSVEVGLLALVQPQIWAGDRLNNGILYVGAAVGPFVQFGIVEIHLPLGAGFATVLDDPFQGRSRDLGGAFNASLMGGVVF